MIPLISIIMACYNEKLEWIEQSIESILNQTYRNIEFIVVCDNPKNYELKQMLLKYKEKDKRIKVILNEKNLGLIKSLNTALVECNGQYIARMDADDVSHLDRIDKQVSFLERNKNIDLVMSYANTIDESGKKIGKKKLSPVKTDKIKNTLKTRNISVHPTWMFRSNILVDLKGYNEVKYVEDYEFLCRCITQGYSINTIPEILLDYRIRRDSVCNSNRLLQQANFQIVNKFYKQILKYGGIISKEYLENEINKCNLSKFQNNVDKAKQLINSNKYIKGYILLFWLYANSSLKRRQLLNEIFYKAYHIKIRVLKEEY